MKWKNLKRWGPKLQWDNRSHTQGPSYGDEGGAFIRQRRSVMLLSLVLLAIHFFNVNAADISLIGIDIQLPDSSWLYISLWIAQLYFIYRFSVFRNLLGEGRFESCRQVYRTKLVGDYGWKLLKGEPQKYVAKPHHSNLITGRKLRMQNFQPHADDNCSYTIVLEPRDDKDQLTPDLAAQTSIFSIAVASTADRKRPAFWPVFTAVSTVWNCARSKGALTGVCVSGTPQGFRLAGEPTATRARPLTQPTRERSGEK